MKTICAIAATLGLGISQASAAPVEFQGGLCLIAVTSACTASGWQVGSCFTFRYAPPNLGDNGPSTRLSLFSGTFALSHTLSTGTLIGTTYKAVQATKVARGGYQYGATSMRFYSHTPATLVATSPYASFLGNIARWDDIAGCTVTFRGSGALRP